jgi:hypothetical protein
VPTDLADQLNESKEFQFTLNQAWKSKLYQAVRKATRELEIKISGLHRLCSSSLMKILSQLSLQFRIDIQSPNGYRYFL